MFTKHCKRQCFFNFSSKPLCRRQKNTEEYGVFFTLSAKYVHARRLKTLYFTVFSTHVEGRVQAFLSNKLLQNTVNYSVFFTCWRNSSSLLAKQIGPKHCILPCFLDMLKQWFKPSCHATCPKTLKITLFSTHVEAMVQAFLPNKVVQNTENYSVFHPHWINKWTLLSKQLAYEHCKLPCFQPFQSNGSSRLGKELVQNTVH